MKTVTKAQAAVMLGISPKEVVRRIESGALKGRKKTASKFSDWLVELPDEPLASNVAEEVKEVLSEAVVPEPEPEPVEKEVEPEVMTLRDRKQLEDKKAMEEASRIPTPKEVKPDDRTKSGKGRSKEGEWWFGN
jgi:hypothetical protein